MASKPKTKKNGRPTAYKAEYAEQAAKLCALGATDLELADFFKVASSTLYLWKLQHKEFSEALTAAKGIADDRVERSLYAKATGYTFDAEEIFQHQGKIVRAKVRKHVPPDGAAMIFWLKNRRKADWRDRHEHTGADGGPLHIVVAKDDADLG